MMPSTAASTPREPGKFSMRSPANETMRASTTNAMPNT